MSFITDKAIADATDWIAQHREDPGAIIMRNLCSETRRLDLENSDYRKKFAAWEKNYLKCGNGGLKAL